MYLNKKAGIIWICILCVLLTGCATSDVKKIIAETKAMPITNMASGEVNSWTTAGIDNIDDRIRAVMDTKGYYVYDNLEEASGSDRMKVNEVIKDINNCLSTRNITNKSMNANLLNYILFFFDNYGIYVYNMGKIDLKGVDNVTKRYVVDVTYNVVQGKQKSKFKKPEIVKGDPFETLKKEIRLKRYMEDISQGQRGNAWGVYQGMEKPLYEYETGTDTNIVNSVQGEYGTQYMSRIIQNINYNNCALTFRYILSLSPITLELSLESAYLLSYTSGDLNISESDSELFTDNTKKKLEGFIENYYKSLNTRNFTGIFNLLIDSGRYEKYHTEMFNNVYIVNSTLIENYYRREGDTINLLLASEIKVKPKDDNISYGVYSQKEIATIKWESGGFKMVDVEPIEIQLKKEPSFFEAEENLYVLEEFELISNEVNDNSKQQVEKLWSDLSKIIVKGEDRELTRFINSTKTLLEIERIRKELYKYDNLVEKYTFIENWIYATSLTCDVKFNEVYILKDKAYNVTSRVKFERVNEQWLISDYVQTYTEEVENKFGTDYFNTSIEKRNNGEG